MEYSDISILIPSLSRPKILIRKLNYYLKLGAKFKICICDSSPKIVKKFNEELQKLSKKLRINYYYRPGLSDREALSYLIENCDSQYSAFIADDDFFIPEGLYKCAKYLEENEDCRVAYGKSIIIDQISLNNPNKPIYASNYWGSKSFLEVQSKDRLDKLSRNYLVNMYGVHRTNEFLEDYKPSSISPSKSMGEVMVSYMTISRGKAKFIPSAYLIRQSHSERYLIPTKLSDLFVEDKLGESLPLFLSSLTNTLERQKNSKDNASVIAKKVVKKYLDNYVFLSNKSNERKSIIDIFKKISFRILNSFRNKLFKRSKYFDGFLFYIKLISKIK